MQPRLVKSIRSTLVTRVDAGPALTDQECAALAQLAERFRPVLELRDAGFSPREISHLEFARWSFERGRER